MFLFNNLNEYKTFLLTYNAGSNTAAIPTTANSAVYGDVTIDEDGTAAASIENVTLNGFDDATLGSTNDLDALKTLSLANSAGVTALNTAATALDLTVNAITGTVNLDGAAANVKTLGLTATGAASTTTLTAAGVTGLTIDATAALNIAGSNVGGTNVLQTVDINGTAMVTLGTIAQSTSLKSFDASGSDGGVSATINAHTAGVDTSFTGYTFSEGADTVTLGNVAVNKAINLGAGNDSITLAAGAPVLTATIDGGTGTNTVVMDAADAATADNNNTFATKVVNFTALTLQNNTVGANGQTTTLSFTDDNLSAGDSIALSFTGLTSLLNINAAFDTDFNTTLDNIAAAIASDDSVFSATRSGSDIVIVGNNGVTFTVGAATTTDQTTALTINTVEEDVGTEVIEISLNPGAWVGADLVVDLTVDGVGPMPITGVNAANDFSDTVDALIAQLELSAAIDSAIYVGDDTGGVLTVTAAHAGEVIQLATNNLNGASATYDKTVIAESAATIILADGAGNAAMAAGDKITVTIGGVDFEQAFVTNWVTTYAALVAQIDNHADYVAVDNIGRIEIEAADTTQDLGGVLSVYTNYDTDIVMTQATDTTVAGGDTVDLEALGGYDYVTVGDATGLVLNNMAANGTVVVDDANFYTQVNVKDADTGKADVLNIIVKSEDAGETAGTVQADEVETVNITTSDLDADENGDGATSLTLIGDEIETVNVDGSGELTLTLSSGVTKVDASGMDGDFILVAAGAAAGTEVIGGSGNNTLSGSGENDVLRGGDNGNTFNAVDLTTMYAGDGVDIFNFAVNSNLAKVSKINGIGSGDQINLVDVENTNALVTKFYAEGAQYNPDTTTDVAGKVNAALKQTNGGEASWFVHGTNTYIVIDSASTAGPQYNESYEAGKDIVIQLVGVYDLSGGASFNYSAGVQSTLEIA